jgi:hypothetical protein
LLTYPLSLVVTRLQVQRTYRRTGRASPNTEYKDVLDAFAKIYAQEGEAAFYTGCLQDTAKTVLDSFLFFLAYNYIKEGRLQRLGTKRLPVYEELGAGMFAGAFARFFTAPVGNIVTRKQTAAMAAAREGKEFQEPSMADIATQIRKEKGIAGFWSGYSATLVLTLNPALTFVLHETLLRMFIRRDDRSNPGSRATFLIAALSKAVASAVTYPFSLAKSRSQVSSKAPTEAETEEPKKEDSAEQATKKELKRIRQRTVFHTVFQIAQEEGVFALYQGLGGEVLKGFFSHGLTMLMKERIHKVVIRVYYLILSLMKKYPSPQELAQATVQNVSSTASNLGEKVADTAKDGASKAQGIAKNLSYQGQEALERTVDTMSHLYHQGRESTMDIVDEYIDTEDD